MGKLLSWLNGRYEGQEFMVTENGWGNASAPTVGEDIADFERCNYYRDYIGNLSAAAARNQIKVSGYFAWSLLYNFEWADGFTSRFGLTYVNYGSQERTGLLPRLHW